MSITSYILTTIAIVSSVNAFGQGTVNDTLERNGLNLGDPEFDSTLREKYVHSSEMPDALAFYTAIGTVSGLNKEKPSLAQGIVRNRMGMDDAKSVEFLVLLIAEYESIESEISSTSLNLMCSQGVPRVSGPDVYTAMDTADDAIEQIAGKHLNSFREALAAEQVNKLNQWIAETKETTVYLKFDHRKRFEQQDSDPDAQIAMVCGR